MYTLVGRWLKLSIKRVVLSCTSPKIPDIARLHVYHNTACMYVYHNVSKEQAKQNCKTFQITIGRVRIVPEIPSYALL